MTGDTGELGIFTIRVLPGTTPGAVRVRQLLKYALRGLELKCVRLAEPDEVTRQRKIIDGLTALNAGHEMARRRK